MKQLCLLLLFAATLFLPFCNEPAPEIIWDKEWQAEIFPAEHIITTDSTGGEKLIYVTTDSASDINLYFDWNCWFKDLSMMTFISQRTGRVELFGYIPKTGELIRLNPREDVNASTQAFADFKTHDIYVSTTDAIFQWHVDIKFSIDSTTVKNVQIRERKIVSAPQGSKFFSALSQSANRQYLSATIRSEELNEESIISVNIQNGKIQTLLTWDNSYFFPHVQFSKYNQHLLRFAYEPNRLWIIDTRKQGEAKKIHLQEDEELVTHEDWWHASGAPNGRWVVADNWHGHIGVTDERTSHMRFLTKNHRIYGGGEHPYFSVFEMIYI